MRNRQLRKLKFNLFQNSISPFLSNFANKNCQHKCRNELAFEVYTRVARHILIAVVINMEQRSIFLSRDSLPKFAPMSENAKADVLVVGGGIAGILTARLLCDAGYDVLLLEAYRLCHGQTGNTTAKITVQHGFCYQEIAKRYGNAGAAIFAEANRAALERYRNMTRGVSCDFEERDFYAYEKSDARALERELAVLSAIGMKASWEMPSELPFPAVGAIRVPGQAQFDPVAFLAAQLSGIRISENTPVVGLFEGGAVTADGKRILAKHTVITTHFPFLRWRGGYPFKMYQSRSYVLALENVPLPRGMWADGSGKGISLRSFGEYLLLGGGTHRTGTAGGGYRTLEEFAAARYKNARVVTRFAAQDCMTLDGMPYIGAYARGLKNVYVATGFGKWGMTSAMLSAMILTDLIREKPNPYAAFFSPSRPIPPLRFLRETGAVLKHYLRPTAPRCPHLGCALRYNRQEHSWDCPCHGSRFAPEGKLLDAPAMRDLKKPPKK